jgi:hypothetical protein
MPGPVPKGWISNGSVEARLALCSRFRVDGLSVLIRKGASGMGQRAGRLWRKICKRFNIWFY